MAVRPVNSAKSDLIQWKTNAVCNAGQIGVVSGGLAVPAAEAPSSSTVIGVFAEHAHSGELSYLYPPDQEFEFDIYQGSSIDTAALANQGVVYDIYVDGAAHDGSAEGEMYIDLNDTTGAFVVLSSYDNTRRVATGRFTLASRYL